MGGHVFISYSHDEAGAYVERLGVYLSEAGVPVWYDRELITGHRWAHVIEEKIDTAAAVIVIMTPSGRKSDWVSREISQAELAGRPILPLLLDGARFFTLANLQYEDVTGQAMPSPAFVARLRTMLPAAAGPDRDDAATDLARRLKQAKAIGNSGDRATAVRLYRDLVTESSQVLGPDDPATLLARHQLAFNVGEAGDRAEAIRLFRELIADRSRILGPHNPATLKSRHQLAYHVGEAGDRAEAIQLHRAVLADRTRALGPSHPDTRLSRDTLAHYVGEAGDRAQAIAIYRDLIADDTRTLGDDHPDTLMSRYKLAYHTGQSGDRTEAVRLLRDLIADYSRVLGPDHAQTRAAEQNLRHYGG